MQLQLLSIRSIPFQRFISCNEAHTDETKIRQKDRESVQRKRIKAQKNTKTHSKTRQKTYIHIYTTRSDFTKALLLALQRAASDFLALIMRVSKLGKPVKSSILVTL